MKILICRSTLLLVSFDIERSLIKEESTLLLDDSGRDQRCTIRTRSPRIFIHFLAFSVKFQTRRENSLFSSIYFSS